VSIWFSKLANRLLPELDVPELDGSELAAPWVDVPDDELGPEEVRLGEVGEALDNAGPEKLMSTIAKLSSVIVVLEPALAALDADELALDPTP
jgi:hypothetical protein